MASTPRNPTIAKVLYLRKAIEMWVRGIGLIVKSCEKARIAAPKIYEDFLSFGAIIRSECNARIRL